MNKGCIIGLGLFLIIITLGLGYYFVQKQDKGPEGVKTTKPIISDIVKKTIATGSVKPRREVNIKPQVSGVVDVLYVEAGALVKKGERIAKIKLVPSQVNINNAQSSVELTRIRYKEAQRELARQKELNSRKLDIENARISFENAKKEELRQKKLFTDGIISELDYNKFKVDMELQKAKLENAKILSERNLKQYEAEVDIRKQELEAAINNLQLLREGATKNSKQVSNIVVSTVSGMVLDVPVEEGSSVIERNNFNEGTTIASVADMNALIFEGMVDESDVGKLKEGMPLELTVGAIENEKFKATLEYISPKGVKQDGTVKFEVRAAIKPSKETFLRAGYSASGDIILEKKEQVIAINERDLLISNDSTFVEIKIDDNKFEKKAITVGLSDGILIEVVNGIDTSSTVKIQKKI
ncbi:MAG TPA: HlyD family efflux transporter periplasmic adaptor subunit [Saprospiraceae bacterium]|nr:HlyD family efflux transporter periplasmic adaptor subunit [Saprospiraceae bacterium]